MAPHDVIAAALPQHDRYCDGCGDAYLTHGPFINLRRMHEELCRRRPRPRTN